MAVIDAHTHMLELLSIDGAPRYEVAPVTGDPEGICAEGALFMTPMPEHFD